MISNKRESEEKYSICKKEVDDSLRSLRSSLQDEVIRYKEELKKAME